MGVRRRVGVPLLAGLSGTLLVLSFPPLALASVAWVALVPLLVGLEGRGTARAFGLSYLAGLVFVIGAFYWVWWVPGYNLLDEALLAVYLGFYLAGWGGATTWVRRRTALPLTLVAPVLWVALEYVRSNAGFLSLPWMLLGHTQYLSPPIIQIAAVAGGYGVTFLVVLVNAALADLIAHARRRALVGAAGASARSPVGGLAVAALLLAAVGLYGHHVTSQPVGAERVTAALVHTSVPRDQKWDLSQRRRILEQNEALTRQAAGTRPELIVWPETAVPGDVQHHAPLRQRVGQVAREAGTTLLVGSAEHAKFTDRRLLDRRYNSMYLFSAEGDIVGHYRKIVLVPFGEYEPLQGVVRWPKAIAAAMGTLLAGDRYTVFTLGSVPFSAVICWEIVFPDVVRRFVQNGARFIVNASNEAWFAGSAMPEQMLAMSVFRAVENRRAVARAANLGISAIIDPYGRVGRRFDGVGPDGAPTDGVLVGDIAVATSTTFYTRHGDVFALACVVASLIALIAAAVPVVARLLGAGVHGRLATSTRTPTSASR